MLASELRSCGDSAGFRDVLAAKKPSRTAWALNQVARRDAEVLRAALNAHAAAARAQSVAEGEVMRETARVFRDRVGDVIKRCAEIVADSGAQLSPSQARRLGETLRAAIGDTGESRQRLLAGRLVDDVDIEEPFAGQPDVAGARVPRVEVQSKTSAAAKARERQAEQARETQRAKEARERAIADARRDVGALEKDVREARELAHQAETVAARAAAEADRARRAVTGAEDRLAKAREALQKL
jgi:hypothetical protein